MKDYTIQFVSLKQGTHFYEYSVDNTFFELFDEFEFNSANINVELEFIKQSSMMLLNFSFSGNIDVPCDRCLTDVEVLVEGDEKLIVKFGNEDYNETDEIMVIPENEHEINVAKSIYEFIEINLPQKRVHEDGDCDEETINRLNEFEVKQNDDIDPRWSGLEKLKN